MKKNIYFILFSILVSVLFVLGGLNIYKKIDWKEPSDGITWGERPDGITAIKVDSNSPGYLAGIRKGDILYSMNDNPTRNKIDVSKNLWEAATENRKVTYQINREGLVIFPTLFLSWKGTNLAYFFLGLIGLTTLVIALIVILQTRKPLSRPYTLFFIISLTFYSFYVFSPTGQMNTLDSLFYWLDEIAFLAFAPLLLNFFIIFPKRKKDIKKRLSSIYFLYLPALVLLLVKVFIHLPNFLNLDEKFILGYFQSSVKLELIHYAVFSMLTLGIVFRDVLKAPNILIRKQLKWVAYGLGIGIIPFTLLYIIPTVAGQVPTRAAELTVVLQALIPLTFSYSISRYKLVDLEVLLKKAVPLFVSYGFLTIIYFIVSSRARIFSESRFNAIVLGILAIILGATLFSPIKLLIQSLLDRVIYKRSYQYRKTLLSISQELSRERNLQKLSQALLDLIANALSLQYIALLLPVDNEKSELFILKSRGEMPSKETHITFEDRLWEHLKKSESLSTYSHSERKELGTDFNELNSYGFFHLMPLKTEDKLIGCLGMGKKIDNTFLNSEDWELLKTISTPVALALENAYLYNQASIRALELKRLKDYSENIIESLTVGVAVLDQKGKIIGWNRVLEETFAKKKDEVMEKGFVDVLGKKNFSAIFPSDTQQDFRLLSEITLEMTSRRKKIFDISRTPLLDNKLNPYGTIIVFEDITEKISLQQQLLTSEKLASIGLLSAGVAHEINTPLTGISSYVQMLQKKLTKSSHAQMLKKIDDQTERVARIVKNLLNFAHNPSETSFYKVDLRENLQAIISLIEYKLKKMNIILELDLSPLKSIWAQGEKLQQVFINIILNALDAMPKGGTLKIKLSQSNNYAVVIIEDTGTGIKTQHLSHIYDPFFTTKGIGKGTGLGLSISYAIIKEHEGHITVNSEHGKGTSFTIYIPKDLEKKEMTESSIS